MDNVTPTVQRCPDCGTMGKVLETRERKGGSVRRTRECMSCKRRWTTVEYYDHKIKRRASV